ncbi:MAG: L-2-amino-thiazoline-4-carboxylic acid hydrolase [Armatimonadota bacterium]
MKKKYFSQIESAIKDRAVMYYYVFEETRKKYGEKTAKEILAKAAYRRGEDKSKKYFKYRNDLRILADTFVKTSPGDNTVFKSKKIRADEKNAVLTMSSCPLVKAWKELGLSKKKIKTLCDAAREIDFGTFEPNGLKLKFESLIGAGDKCCRLVLAKKQS